MTYEAHSATVGRYRVRVVLDDDYCLASHMHDEPVNVIGFDYRYGWHADTIYEGAKTSLPELEALAIASRDLTRLFDAFEGSWYECQKLADGRHKLTGRYLERARYYKTEAALFDAVCLLEGYDLRDIRCEEISSGGDTYVIAWSQSELDRYAGCKNAPAPVETVQAVLDGDVWGYIVDLLDDDGDVIEDYVESCWGFIGNSEYCLSEGVAVAEGLEARRVAAENIAFAADLEASRPDLYAPEASA